MILGIVLLSQIEDINGGGSHCVNGGRYVSRCVFHSLFIGGPGHGGGSYSVYGG